MKEIWKPVNGFVGVYEVSNLGRVRRICAGRGSKIGIKKLNPSKTGYVLVNLSKKNTQKIKTVHSLVAKAFISNKKNKPCINHIDSNPSNNHVSNLEWCTHLENMQHASRQRRLNVPHLKARGKNNFGGITKEKVLEIRKLWLLDKKPQREIASIYKVSRQTINNIINKKAWGYV